MRLAPLGGTGVSTSVAGGLAGSHSDPRISIPAAQDVSQGDPRQFVVREGLFNGFLGLHSDAPAVDKLTAFPARIDEDSHYDDGES